MPCITRIAVLKVLAYSLKIMVMKTYCTSVFYILRIFVFKAGKRRLLPTIKVVVNNIQQIPNPEPGCFGFHNDVTPACFLMVLSRKH